jgi:hypothetical protein
MESMPFGSMVNSFDVQGFNRTYWDLFCGGRILCRRVLSIRGDIGMAASGLPAHDFGAHARHCVTLALCFAAITVVSCRYLFIMPILSQS